MGGAVIGIGWGEMALAVLLYLSLGALAAGLVSLAKPLRFLGISHRRAAGAVCGAAVVMGLLAFLWPAREHAVASPASRLDAIVPAWEFAERHSIHVSAPPERVYRAMRDVTAGEIRLFRTLTAIRRFGRRGPENILNAPESQPILDVATRTGFEWLADDPPREVVVGTRLGPLTRAVMNFRVTPQGDGSLLVTETRVHASTPAARRVFAAYWRVILPGSDLIRRSWLRAIARRAEGRVPA